MSAASPQSVREILAEIEAIDGAGCWHGAIFYSSTAAQELARIRTARRLARSSDVARAQYLEKLRIFRESGCSMGCCFCNRSFSTLDDATIVGTELLHRDCAKQFSVFVADCELVALRYEITDAGEKARSQSDAAASWEADSESRALAAGDR
jgi:hypothetical protein